MSNTSVSWPDLDTAEVARRLRMYMGDKKISRAHLAATSGINRTSLAAKLDAHTPFTLDEISRVGRALGHSWLWVLIGTDPGDDPSDQPGDRRWSAGDRVSESASVRTRQGALHGRHLVEVARAA